MLTDLRYAHSQIGRARTMLATVRTTKVSALISSDDCLSRAQDALERLMEPMPSDSDLDSQLETHLVGTALAWTTEEILAREG